GGLGDEAARGAVRNVRRPQFILADYVEAAVDDAAAAVNGIAPSRHKCFWWLTPARSRGQHWKVSARGRPGSSRAKRSSRCPGEAGARQPRPGSRALSRAAPRAAASLSLRTASNDTAALTVIDPN